MTKFRNKYRIESARAQWWNYAAEGAYFITICTADRLPIFGQIIQKKMTLSPMGNIVHQEWNHSFEMRKELCCDIVVIMPDHLHAILRIAPVETHGCAPHVCAPHGCAPESESLALETHSSAPLPQNINFGVAYRPPKSISSFVAGFKSSATKKINEYRQTPGVAVWQSRFHDRIIREQKEYDRIFTYIENNVENWNEDKQTDMNSH
jgi:REP element-mobilizing transposase RayT